MPQGLRNTRNFAGKVVQMQHRKFRAWTGPAEQDGLRGAGRKGKCLGVNSASSCRLFCLGHCYLYLVCPVCFRHSRIHAPNCQEKAISQSIVQCVNQPEGSGALYQAIAGGILLIQSHFGGSAKYIVHFDEIDIFFNNPAPGSA